VGGHWEELAKRGTNVITDPVLDARTRIAPSATQVPQELTRPRCANAKGFAKSSVASAQNPVGIVDQS
jgi:hypothetical protein